MNEPTEQDLQNPQNIDIPDQLPLLPVRDIVVFPYMVLPLFVGREMSIKAIEAALASNRMIFLATQKALDVENPKPVDIHSVGTVGIIMRMLKLPDERIKILVQGLAKGKVEEYIQTEPYYSVRISKVAEAKPPTPSLETEAVMRTVKEQIERIVSLGKVLIPDVMVVIENLEDPGRLADMVVSNLGLKVDITQRVLEITDPIQRLRQVSDILGQEIEVLSMQQKIQAQAKGEMDKTQREYFLREQLKAIQKELGELDERAEEIAEFRKRIKDAKMPEKVLKECEKQLKRLEKMHPDTAESATVRTYLEWMVELPWSKKSKDNLDIKAAAKVLNEDHYDLEKVKERILEYLAVRKLKDKMKGPILCFVGPPGVGKTSLGKSIARALGREFVRVSLGGVRDEAEIRGHRRTYVGALPGRIIQGIKQAGTNNPVFMMDEVDKVGMDFRGDPSAALLEVLESGAEPCLHGPLLGRAVRLERGDVYYHRELDGSHPAGAAGPDGDHRNSRLHRRGEAGHHAKIPDPPAALRARHHGEAYPDRRAGHPPDHFSLHQGGRRPELGTGNRQRHAEGGEKGRRGEGQVLHDHARQPPQVSRRPEIPARVRVGQG
ncbi:MAG: hypothetical protein KatS3mg082_1490 [Nitrospiraceae bacterium]|nr:MAG: hypothetical protein KatS3mg082_1490 [Nitrospiraceae bacterium]